MISYTYSAITQEALVPLSRAVYGCTSERFTQTDTLETHTIGAHYIPLCPAC